MGGQSSSTQTQSSSVAPYAPASGALNGILGSITNLAPGAGSLNPAQADAMSKIESNANGTPNYAPQIATGTYGLLNGGGANDNNPAISNNLSNYTSNIGSIANGSMVGKNSALQPQLDTIASDVTNQVNGEWAAAGRDGSPGNTQALARGIAQVEAPLIAAQYNTDVSNQLGAASSLYNAGNATYGMLNSNQAQSNQKFENGVGTVSNGVN